MISTDKPTCTRLRPVMRLINSEGGPFSWREVKLTKTWANTANRKLLTYGTGLRGRELAVAVGSSGSSHRPEILQRSEKSLVNLVKQEPGSIRQNS